MQDGWLKRQLQSCTAGPFSKSDFSIGHRGAALQFPEHTRESYEAGARMGAGILECDVTFTKDSQLVCRHAQNDLHTTTNILVTSLAGPSARSPLRPRSSAPTGRLYAGRPRAECRTSDITLAEFKTLRGKMDASDPRALTPEQFQGGTANFRTDLYAGPTSGELLTHAESIELFKPGRQDDPGAEGAERDDAVQRLHTGTVRAEMIDEYKAARSSPRRVFPQSFDINRRSVLDRREPAFGRQAVYLDDANVVADLPNFANPRRLQADGDQHLGAAHLRAAGPRRPEPHRALAGRARCQGGRTRSSSPGRWSARDSGRRQQRLLLPDDRSGDQT